MSIEMPEVRGDEEEETPMLGPTVGIAEINQASGSRQKMSKCLVRYVTVLLILFICMWTLLGEEEVSIGGTFAKIGGTILPSSGDDPKAYNVTPTPSGAPTLAPTSSPTSPPMSPPTTSPTLTVNPAPSGAIKPFQPIEATAGVLLSSIKFVSSNNALYADVNTSPFVVNSGDKAFKFSSLEEWGGEDCSMKSSLAVFADARIGGIFDNYWHTVVTFGMPMYWHLPDRFRTLSDLALVIKHPTLQKWHTDEEKAHLASADWLTHHGVGVSVIELLFPGGIYVVDVNNRDYGIFCADQAYVQGSDWKSDEHSIEDVWDFRTRIMTAIPLTPTDRTAVKGEKIVWVSRANAHYHKHIVNENELLSKLRNDYPSATVDVVDLELLTLKEQATTFADASLIVMVRGAGSVNTLFLSKEATVFYINFGSGFEPFPHFDEAWFSVVSYVPTNLDYTGQGPNFNNMNLLPNEFWSHITPALELAGFSKGSA